MVTRPSPRCCVASLALALFSSSVVGCGSSDGTADAGGRDDGGTQDSATGDQGTSSDATIEDASEPDVGPSDAGETDAGDPDAGDPDAGSMDAGDGDMGGSDDQGVVVVGDPSFTAVPLKQNILEDAANLVLSVGIASGENGPPETALSLIATSSDPSVLGVSTGGAGANRNVTLDPQLNRFGMVMVTLTLSDGERMMTSMFDVTINPVNDAPVLTATSPTTIQLGQDAASLLLQYTVTDVDRGDGGFPVQTPLQEMTASLTFDSSNPNLVVDPYVVLGQQYFAFGFGEGASGTVTFSFSVTDDGGPPQTSNVITYTVIRTP